MSEMQDYKSSLSDVSSRKFETFSYLPEMDADGIRKQVEYIVSKGWNPAIEHTEPENAMSHYWYMWKLPMFGETDVDRVLPAWNIARRRSSRAWASFGGGCWWSSAAVSPSIQPWRRWRLLPAP